ncbi:hypothetical protein DUI87_10853 [Hirundo rustica rustica]|uniref:Reverse transcriptase domain-containing protein n=1 Tax=Hirundo rustica rustica TaxID=333673 RepID=A0A3M0KJ89_HIRRU|nr:hypothetical protein DUI87_10853 [Hirundo rustica rustica]
MNPKYLFLSCPKSREDLVSKVDNDGHPGHSDHKAIKFKISVDRTKAVSKTSPPYKTKADFRFLRFLKSSQLLMNIVPVLKKDKKENPGNYRHISVTSVPGKVVDMILGGVDRHLKDNAVTGHSRHGYMRAKSCLSNLTSFDDKVTHLTDQGKPVDIIFLDLTASFWTKCPAHSWINTSWDE